jgi:type I restriction enzyme M protein
VLDTGAVSRGSGSRGRNKERDLRQAYVERDRIASVILLPENLFVNTSAPGIIMVLDQAKAHPGEILLINASDLHAKGRPKNYVAEEQIAQIHRLYQAWEDSEGLAAVITNEEAARADYNLSPSRHVARDDGEEVLSLEDAMVLLTEADEERAQADAALRQVLAELGLETGQTE